MLLVMIKHKPILQFWILSISFEVLITKKNSHNYTVHVKLYVRGQTKNTSIYFLSVSIERLITKETLQKTYIMLSTPLFFFPYTRWFEA